MADPKPITREELERWKEAMDRLPDRGIHRRSRRLIALVEELAEHIRQEPCESEQTWGVSCCAPKCLPCRADAMLREADLARRGE